MKFKTLMMAAAAAAIGFAGPAALTGEVRAAEEQFFPVLVYRTGPYAPSGIPIANGFRDYYEMLNKRDGGVNGVKITTEECETKYNTKLGVECYEKLKNANGGATYFNPYSTGITYQLIPKASVDEIPILSMGYGRTSAADGRVFEWVFNFPTNYWDQATVFTRYIADREGGLDNLKGKKIALLYHNSAYGKEPISTFEVLSRKYGFTFEKIAVDHPGQEQSSQWRLIRRKKPDWVIMWGWGVMNQVAIQEAAKINFPMDRFIGVIWSGSEADVEPAGDKAKGYLAGTFHASGLDHPVIQDIIKHVYGGDVAKAKENKVGEVLYNRAVYNAAMGVEAVRTAQAKFGEGKRMSGDQVRWGFENLNVTEARLAEMGMKGFARPLQVSCLDHSTGGAVFLQQWDGTKWSKASEWITPMTDVVRPLIEEDAAKYAKENGITPRACS